MKPPGGLTSNRENTVREVMATSVNLPRHQE